MRISEAAKRVGRNARKCRVPLKLSTIYNGFSFAILGVPYHHAARLEMRIEGEILTLPPKYLQEASVRYKIDSATLTELIAAALAPDPDLIPTRFSLEKLARETIPLFLSLNPPGKGWIELDLQEKCIDVGADGPLNYYVEPLRVSDGRAVRFSVDQCIRGDALARLITGDKFQSMCKRALSGSTAEFLATGRWHVDLSDDAENAISEIEQLIERVDSPDLVDVYDARDYSFFDEERDISTLWPANAALEDIVEAIEDEAENHHAVLIGDMAKGILDALHARFEAEDCETFAVHHVKALADHGRISTEDFDNWLATTEGAERVASSGARDCEKDSSSGVQQHLSGHR